VEAHARRGVEVEIGVMHHVKTPERGHRMKQQMLDVIARSSTTTAITISAQIGSATTFNRPNSVPP
jgi:hypothetical protein